MISNCVNNIQVGFKIICYLNEYLRYFIYILANCIMIKLQSSKTNSQAIQL